MAYQKINKNDVSYLFESEEKEKEGTAAEWPLSSKARDAFKANMEND